MSTHLNSKSTRGGIRRRAWLLGSALLLGILLALPMAQAPAQVVDDSDLVPATSGPPAITTSKDDYVPDELVDLTGSGWQPGESIDIVVDDLAGSTWRHNATVTADEFGAFFYEFQLPNWFVATYTVTATGDAGGSASWSFADSIAVGASSTNSTNGQQITLSAPAVTVGDLLVVHIAITDSINTTFICPPAGWTTILKNTRDDKILQETFWFRATAAAGATSYTFQFRTSSCDGSLITSGTKGASGGVVRFTGVITSGNPIDVVGGNNSSSSGPFTAPAVTTTVANAQVVRFFGVFKNTDITHASTPQIYHVKSSTTKERAAAAFNSGVQAAVGSTGIFTATLASVPKWPLRQSP